MNKGNLLLGQCSPNELVIEQGEPFMVILSAEIPFRVENEFVFKVSIEGVHFVPLPG